MITVADAIISLGSTLKFKIIDDVVHWQTGIDATNTAEYSGSPSYSVPTQAEIDAEVVRLQAIEDGNAYQRTRAAAYPSIGDQLDMIYHNGDGGATFQAAIKAVKDATPKP
jgi:hypothetical protein